MPVLDVSASLEAMEPARRMNSIRLQGWDYRSTSAYFVTIAIWKRQPLLGLLHHNAVALSDVGMIVAQCWNKLPDHYPQLCLDEWIVMPDHFHGIAWIETNTTGTQATLGNVVGSFKSASTRSIRLAIGNHDLRVWQRGYHDRIIRNAEELARIRQYIRNNPQRT